MTPPFFFPRFQTSTDIDTYCALLVYRSTHFGGNGSSSANASDNDVETSDPAAAAFVFEESRRRLPALGERSLRTVGPCGWRVLVRRGCSRRRSFSLGGGSRCEANSRWGMRANCIRAVFKIGPKQQ